MYMDRHKSVPPVGGAFFISRRVDACVQASEMGHGGMNLLRKACALVRVGELFRCSGSMIAANERRGALPFKKSDCRRNFSPPKTTQADLDKLACIRIRPPLKSLRNSAINRFEPAFTDIAYSRARLW
jgi:hypothetical protein